MNVSLRAAVRSDPDEWWNGSTVVGSEVSRDVDVSGPVRRRDDRSHSLVKPARLSSGTSSWRRCR
jgi:hypothetical protein